MEEPVADTGAAPEGSGTAPEDLPAGELARALGAAVLPAWRKAYLSNLIASGRRFAGIGNARGAEYCFAKVDEALRSAPQAAPAGMTGAEAAAASAPAQPERPADRARARLRLDRIAHAEKVLESHGARLSGLEKKSYRDRLAKLRQDSAQPSQAGKADAGLLDLRRRLYQRVLKSQKAALQRKRAPASAPSRPPRLTATPAAWQPVTGPYNDRSNLEELLAVVSAADPAWVEEFLELYGELAALSALLPAGQAPKK